MKSLSHRILSKLAALTIILSPIGATAQHTIDLSGKWESTLGEVKLPGSLLTNNKGDDLSVKTQWTGSLYDSSYYFNPYMEKYRHEGRMKFPFFLTPNKHFVGTVTYTKRITIPKQWAKKRVVLYLERPHIETTVSVNGREAGHQMSLNTPHVYDVSELLNVGEENEIAIKVYNGIENVCVGQDSHSVTDQTQGNWNGIVGRIELQAHGRQTINGVRIYPDINKEQIRVVVCANTKRLKFMINGTKVKAQGENDSTFIISIPNPKLWSEFSPNLYKLTVSSKDDTMESVFGMREVKIKGRQFYLNGTPIWLRATVENCTFPLTGYPPTDVDSWENIFRKCKEYGLNAMRFHSYCPPEAAFVAADQVGFYLQPEGPSWPNHGVKLRRNMPIDQYLMDETKRMVEAYGNHPSFVMMAAGNEPAGNWVEWCNDWVNYWKKTDDRRVYCGASVGGGWAWDDQSQYHVKGGARGLAWDKHAPQSEDNFNKEILYPANFKPTPEYPVNTEPNLSHELGQWCAFPDLKERSQYTGVYKALNFDIFEDLLRDNGMLSQAEKFLHASGKLQVLAYKYDIERNLRTKDYAGFQMLSLNDYSGQGTALVGPLNVFWREKGYVGADEWRQFCSEVVPLAKFPKFIYTNDETLKVPVELYNAAGRNLLNARSTYTIHDVEGKEYVQGVLSQHDIPLGKNQDLGMALFDLSQFMSPKKLILTVNVAETSKSGDSLVSGSPRTMWSNEWEFWVYPKQIEMPTVSSKGNNRLFMITDTLDAEAVKMLKKGGSVLIEAAGKVRYGSDVVQHYLPVFWNTSWFKMRPPHTTGITIETEHPLFKEFPTDDWSNLNWWELTNNAQVMNLSLFPKSYQSPIQPIDTWHVSRKLGMLFEANVLGGKLIMTTMDISSNLGRRVVARQMRKAIIDYMLSDSFQPTLNLDPKDVTNLFENMAPPVNMFTKDSPDELKPRLKP